MLILILGMIWGSSFVLMMLGKVHLNAFEIAALRNGVAGLFFLPIMINSYQKIDSKTILILTLAGWIGNGIPAILYSYVADKIDSNISGLLNSTTPLFTLIFGYIAFKRKINKLNILGVLIGFFGIIILFAIRHQDSKINVFALLPLFASLLYGINTNLLKNTSHKITPSQMVAWVYGTLLPFAVVYLLIAGTLDKFTLTPFTLYQTNLNIDFSNSVYAILILGVLGSALTSVGFYYLLRQTSPLIASMTTYIIPLMSIFWGYQFGEFIGLSHFLTMGIILIGVFLVNYSKT